MIELLQNEPVPLTRGSTLGLIRRLLTRLHAEDIVYCHWKSNEHLRASMLGHTDLDLLFDRRSHTILARTLAELDFKRFSAVPSRAYPGIEDYLGMDPDTGTLIHLHVHYRLTLGERYIKGYRLPWEDTLLASRVLDDQEGIFTADPALEALLLVTRMALKIRLRDRIASWMGRPYFVGGALRELRWLAERLTPEQVVDHARPLVGEAAADRLASIVLAARPSIHQLVAFRDSINPTLADRRTYGAFEAHRQRWAREARGIWARRTSNRRREPVKRVNPRGGLLVALVGPDGAGKSTLANEAGKWLSSKLDVVITYGGSGAGSAGLFRRALQTLSRTARTRASQQVETTRDPNFDRQGDLGIDLEFRWTLRNIGRVLSAVALDRERRARLKTTRRLTNLGMIVLSDRYPQSQFLAYNDGPRLSAWTDGGPVMLRWAARRERATFLLAEASAPDLVIKLLVSFDVAAARKPDTPPAQLRRKIAAVRALRFPATTRVVEVDAEAPLADVLRSVQRAIWEQL